MPCHLPTPPSALSPRLASLRAGRDDARRLAHSCAKAYADALMEELRARLHEGATHVFAAPVGTRIIGRTQDDGRTALSISHKEYRCYGQRPRMGFVVANSDNYNRHEDTILSFIGFEAIIERLIEEQEAKKAA